MKAFHLDGILVGGRKMIEEINQDRRRFLATAIIASAQLGMIGSSAAQSSKAKPATVAAIKPGTNTSFGSLKQVDAGVLNVGYAEAGPIDGPPVILLHGWPYDIHSFVDVAPLLAKAVQGDRSLCARLRPDAFSVKPNFAEWPAVGSRSRYDRSHGYSQNR
jgi:hypothetical protein